MSAIAADRAYEAQSKPALRNLAALEMRRSVRHPLLWTGFVLSGLLNLATTTDWSAGSYGEKMQGIAWPLAVTAFVAGYLTSRRDRRQPLVEALALDENQRTLARTATAIVPAGMAVVMAVAIAVVSRIEGGFWIGEAPRRTDRALHSPLELMQPVLIVAFISVAGVAAGRAGRSGRPRSDRPRLAGAALFLVAFATLGPASWVVNQPPVHVVTILQFQPLDVDLGRGLSSTVPRDWLVEQPTEFGDGWRRRLVHTPTIVGHHLYLLGLVAVAFGAAVRTVVGRRALLSGSLLAIAGVVMQLVVMPAGIT